MRKNGQLFSLDFIISMVAVTAAIGLLLHSIEVNAYSQKEQQLHDELKQVAETAADLLVASDGTTCEIRGIVGPVRVYLANCIDEKKSGGLGDLFPSGYCYKITSTRVNSECSTPYKGQDFYETTRLIVTNDDKISKANFENKIFTSGATAIPISVRVWKI